MSFKKVNFFTFLLLFSILVLFYQNCSPTFKSTHKSTTQMSSVETQTLEPGKFTVANAINLSNAGEKIYNYAPAAILDGGKQYLWTCNNNPTPGEFHDVIGFFINGNYQGWAIDNGHSTHMDTNWKGVHVCDPSVIQGNFQYNGNHYQYMMSFLGEDWNDANGNGIFGDPGEFSMHNQTGIAFANSLSGPWVEYPKPLLTFSDRYHWGVGQPSLIALDKDNILIIYTRGEAQKTSMYYRILNFSNFSDSQAPAEFQSEREVSAKGLTALKVSGNHPTRPGRKIFDNVVLRNADFVLRPSDKTLFMVRGHDYLIWSDKNENNQLDGGTEIEKQIAYAQLASIKLDDFVNNTGQWEPISFFEENTTGFLNNHNPGFMRTAGGYVLSENELTVLMTTHGDSASQSDGRIEWDYRIQKFNVCVKAPAQPAPVNFMAAGNLSVTVSSNPTFTWNSATGHNSYILDISTNANFTSGGFLNCPVSASATSITWSQCYNSKYGAPNEIGSTPTPGATYYYRLAAFKGSEVKLTAISSFTVPSANLNYTFSWSAYAEATQYYIDISTNSNFNWFWNCNSTSTSISWSNCQSRGAGGVNDPPTQMPTQPSTGTIYYYRIVPFIGNTNQGVIKSGSFSL